VNPNTPPARRPRRAGGFTLIELLVVVTIIALATAGAVLTLRDGNDSRLEREGLRLAALLESARAQSRASGVPVRWLRTDSGFRFEGLPPDALPGHWLETDTRVQGPMVLVLGPEPVIEPQQIVLVSGADGTRTLRLATDGLRPFSIQPSSP